IDGRIDDRLLADHPIDDFLEELVVGLPALAFIERLARGASRKLREHFADIGAGDIHLIKRLHSAKPGCRAGDGTGTAVRSHRCLSLLAIRRRKRTIANAASAAPPPLSISLTRARAIACCSFSQVRMPLPMQSPFIVRSTSPRADSFATIS